MFGTVVDVLTVPGEFFERREDPSLRGPAAVVLLAGVVQLAVLFPVVYELRFVVPARAIWLAVGLSVVAAFVLMVGKWLLLAGVLYGVARPLGGEGRSRDLLAYLGWSYLPNVLGSVVVLAATLVVLASLDPPTSVGGLEGFGREFGRGPLVDLAAAYGAVETEVGASLDQVQFLVAVGQLFWDAYIWLAAVRVGLGLTGRRALLALAPPVVVGGVVVGLDQVTVGLSF